MNKKVKNLIAQILKSAKELTDLTGRPFTPDGHMVGSIGELYAQDDYGVQLYPPGHKDYDGIWNGREVQVKAHTGKLRRAQRLYGFTAYPQNQLRWELSENL